MASITINVDNSIFNNSSNVIGQVISDESALQELESIREKLNDLGVLAVTIQNLETAIKKQDKPTIKKIVQELSTGFVSGVFSGMASAGLMGYLGL